MVGTTASPCASSPPSIPRRRRRFAPPARDSPAATGWRGPGAPSSTVSSGPSSTWHDPAAYEELVAGEEIHPRILDALDLDGRSVCDAGAGSGRFTLYAAGRAARVIAVDEVPPLLRRLEDHLRERGIGNVEVRRGSFTDLPLPDRSVDVAVACSSLTSREPFGGDPALRELERVVRPGGEIAVIWPDRPEWFRDRGFVHLAAAGNDSRRFTSPAAAERLCRDFYSEEAAAWVVGHRTAEVPFSVLGVPPPNDLCLKTVPEPR